MRTVCKNLFRCFFVKPVKKFFVNCDSNTLFPNITITHNYILSMQYYINLLDTFLNKKTFAEQMARRDSKWKRNLVSIFIIAIMVFSVLAVMLSGSSEQAKKYNGYKFAAKNNKWILNMEGKQIEFDYFPSDIENIPITDEIKNKILNTKMLYITFNPKNVTESMDKFRFDLTNLLSNLYGIHAAGGITKSSEQYNLPDVTCRNSTLFVPVLELKLNNRTEITIKDSCITAKAESSKEMTRIRDAVIYKLIGVMK